ncbi:GDSL-type esterase/lipase family protein [Brevibacillus choshinensis]|uniref:G-D-S-L family lipolytic protein n=1 Tax=Brevibacillus choshinensis TaxID=54911 RepID=A0ABX7FJA7_BRECH|nr:GDSL-type esterase/lipase family protein [Brevibacillus choshinensis]QRG66313.1 G-D-S-L family lipolytic protein [Brevibacillus choshinensis]
MNQERPHLIRPGFFSINAAADRRRNEFDFHNEALLYHDRTIDTIFFGDSITHWWDLSTFFANSPYTIINRGIGGDTTTHARLRFPADVLQLRPRHVIILIGINNTWALDAFSPVDRLSAEEIYRQVTGDVDSMVQAALEMAICPVVCSLLPTRMDRYARNDERNDLVVRINQAFKTMAAGSGAIYVDYHSHLTDSDGLTLREELADDGLHPHVIGYGIMTKVLCETLSAHGIELLG